MSIFNTPLVICMLITQLDSNSTKVICKNSEVPIQFI